MRPTTFNQANGVTVGGASQSSPFDYLPVYRDGKEILSCWRPSLHERIAILLRGRVWLMVATPTTHPPVTIDGGRIFERD